jgi:hypothetical protein
MCGGVPRPAGRRYSATTTGRCSQTVLAGTPAPICASPATASTWSFTRPETAVPCGRSRPNGHAAAPGGPGHSGPAGQHDSNLPHVDHDDRRREHAVRAGRQHAIWARQPACRLDGGRLVKAARTFRPGGAARRSSGARRRLFRQAHIAPICCVPLGPGQLICWPFESAVACPSGRDISRLADQLLGRGDRDSWRGRFSGGASGRARGVESCRAQRVRPGRRRSGVAGS